MNYTEFKNSFQEKPLIISRDVLRLEKKPQQFLNQLNRWKDKGLITELKRGVYVLNKNDRKIELSRMFIANQLYGPSYVSLESALGVYGLIPEKVADLTSVASKKTARFKNEFGEFIYQHIKPQAFRGFKMEKDTQGYSFFIAEPEKAVLDFLYFNLRRFPREIKEELWESLRFQNTEIIRINRLKALSVVFKSPRLTKTADSFCEFVRKECKKHG